MPVIRRLSLDIDILCAAPADTLEKSITEVATVAPFVRYEEDDRGARGLPLRRHFKFFYSPILEGNPAPFVILDVVEEYDIPHEVVVKTIKPDLLQIERDVTVTVPTIESLLADKLTAFAPRTIGVPLFPPHGRDADTMQIIKQLFDVGALFDLAEDLSVVRRVYRRVFVQENEYRGGGFSHKQALGDTLDAALLISRHELKGVVTTSEAQKMVEGVRKLSGHLVNHRFNLVAAKIAAAKAALMSQLVLAENEGNSLIAWRALPAMEEIGTLTIEGSWSRLQRLRNTSPEAFFYWYQAAKLQLMLC